MTNGSHYDVIIIGAGAGGGTLAYKLAPSGKRILLLERGDYVEREKDNWDPKAVNAEGKYQTKEIWRDRDGLSTRNVGQFAHAILLAQDSLRQPPESDGCMLRIVVGSQNENSGLHNWD